MSNFFEWVKLIADILIIAVIVAYKNNIRKFIVATMHIRLKESERLEREIVSFDKAILPKIVTDENGVISIVNKAAESMLGWKEEELFGKNITIVISESDKGKVTEKILKMKGAPMQTEINYQTVALKNNFELPVETVLRKEIVRDHYVYLFVFRDRSKELRIIKNLEQIIDRYKAELEVLRKGEEIGKNGSWIWDIEKDTLATSFGYRKIMGLNEIQVEFERQFLRNKVFYDDNDIVAKALNDAFKGQSYEITYRVMRSSDFKLVEINSKAKPIMNDNKKKVLFIYGSMRMISEKSIIV